MFYDNENEFKKFSKEVKKINYNFQKQKRYKYTLLDKGDNGFIRMIYEDSCLSKYQKEKIEEITQYFGNKQLTTEEIYNYKKYHI